MTITYLDKQDFTFINEQTITAHGGNFMPPQIFCMKKI